MNILNNESYSNIKYGIDPHDDSDYLVITGNYTHDNGDHGIICSQRCDNLVISNNTSTFNNGHGIMLHRSNAYSTISNNYVANNTQAGIAIFESFNNVISNNTLVGNQYGIRFSIGSCNNTVTNNDIGYSTQYGFYSYVGSDPVTAGVCTNASGVADGRPKNNFFQYNVIHDTSVVNGLSTNDAVKLTDSDYNIFDSNTFAANETSFRMETSTGNIIKNNTMPTGMTNRINGNYSGFTSTASYTNQPFIKLSMSYGAGTFTDATGAVYYPGQTNPATTINSSGSTLYVNNALVGSAANVTRTGLCAKVTGSDTVAINIIDTNLASPRKWLASGTPSTAAVSYQLKGLSAYTSYSVTKQLGSAVTTVSTSTTDGNGVLNFTDATGAGTATYTVVGS